PGAGAGVAENVRDSRPDHPGRGIALAPDSVAVGYGGIYPQPAARAGIGVPGDVGGGAAGGPDRANLGCQQSAVSRTGCTGRAGIEGTGSGEEGALAGEE